jgi:multicomponent Na+:H+ antiporter subunit A
VIISDFRGPETLAEITVLLIAVVGVATLLRVGRLW